jgi:hypothetical protein
MKKNKLKNISGVTLVEILIGIAVSALMITAMFTTYNVVNNSYTQVTDRAKISRSGRDVIAMIMRDIRLAGYKFYMGANTLGIPKGDNLTYHAGEDEIEKSHDPLIIIYNELGYDPTGGGTSDSKINTAKDKCCDKIHIVYGDFDHTDVEQPYKRYKITYYAKSRGDINNPYYGIYRTKESWIEDAANPGSWIVNCEQCYHEELVRDHLDDMEFVAFDKHGRNLFNSMENGFPRPDKASRTELYNIRIVDVRLTFRSKDEVYKPGSTKARWVKGLGDRARAYFDRWLRDSVVVSIHTRNIGS